MFTSVVAWHCGVLASNSVAVISVGPQVPPYANSGVASTAGVGEFAPRADRTAASDLGFSSNDVAFSTAVALYRPETQKRSCPFANVCIAKGMTVNTATKPKMHKHVSLLSFEQQRHHHHDFGAVRREPTRGVWMPDRALDRLLCGRMDDEDILQPTMGTVPSLRP